MADKKNGVTADLARQHKNTLDTKFHLRFVERLYDGSPRWHSHDWQVHVNRVHGDRYDTLDREPGVKKLVDLAHDRLQFYNIHIPYLETCVNPVCPLRSWLTAYFLGSGNVSYIRDENDSFAGPFPSVEAREVALEAVKRDLKSLALGKWNDLQDSCPQCSRKQPVFAVSPITDKWVYVLKGSGQSLTPYALIDFQSPSSGFIYTRYHNGEFQSDGQAFDGRLFIDKIESDTWHFFLSRVKLGREALKLLSRAPAEDPKYEQRRNALNAEKWRVAVIPDLQPWTATVKRKFHPRQLKTPYEWVPLVDAFAWAAEIADFDYRPILAAQQTLIQDSDEQAKSFVAATLAQVIGKRKVHEDPPKYDEDSWSVRGETVDVPSGYASKPNIAEAWVDRYQKILDYLTEQTNFACTRLWFPVRFSLAHRIIELACQENQNDPEFLEYALMHWAHILREMLACQSGEAFTTWLADNSEAADRVPQKNVLGGEGLDPMSKIARAIGLSLPVHLLAYVSPVLVAKSDEPRKVLGEHLAKIGVESGTAWGLKDALSIRNFALSIGPAAIGRYTKTLPPSLDGSTLRKLAVAEDIKGTIETFSQMKQVEEGFTLLIELSEYGKKEERTDSEWERNAYKDAPGVAEKVKEKIDTPTKIASFLGEQAHKLMKATVLSGESETEIIEKLEKKGLGAKVLAKALSKEERELLAASRSLACFRWVGIGLKVLAGPIGLVIGGCELVAQRKEMMQSLRAGDPGAAIAHGLQAAATALVIVVAGAECVALFTGAATAAWAGPVGWIAAALMILGGIIIAFCSKNDLQLYARHCFLGVDYGNGEYDRTGKAWMGRWGWAELRYQHGLIESPKRFQRQRLALLRMLCGFETRTGPETFAGGFLYPSLVPAGAYFEIEVDVMPEGSKEPKETHAAVLWPDRGEYVWRKPEPGTSSRINFNYYGGRLTSIGIQAWPAGFEWQRLYYNLRVRLLFDSDGQNGLPVTTKWVKNPVLGFNQGRYVASSEADTSTKERGEADEEPKETATGE